MHLYSQIVNDFQQMIEEQSFKPGDKMPSIRDISKKRGVSISTATRAYFELEARGLIIARPRSGYYVAASRLKQMSEPSVTDPEHRQTPVLTGNLIRSFIRQLRTPDLAPLGCANPSTDLLPLSVLRRSLNAACREEEKQSAQYEFPPGNRALRDLLVRQTAVWPRAVSLQNIIITSGCMNALFLAMKTITSPGDAVAIESPCYYGFLQVLEMLNLKAVEVPTHPREGMDLDTLETLLSSGAVNAVLLSSTCSNPLGATMPDAGKRRLCKMLEVHNVYMVEDDIYGDISFAEARPLPAKAFDSHGRIFYCSSWSKTLAPGYRIGWLIAPNRIDDICELQFTTTVGAAAPLQRAMVRFIEGGYYDRHIERLRQHFQRTVARYAEAISAAFPADTAISRPTGGFVMWLQLAEQVDAGELFSRAEAAGISIAPGPIFSPRGGYSSAIRISAGFPLDDSTSHAITTLGRMVHKLSTQPAGQ